MGNSEIRWSESEKEPFLSSEVRERHSRRVCLATLGIGVLLAGHIVVSLVFGSVLITNIKSIFRNAGLLENDEDFVKAVSSFGGLPVLHDKHDEPYVTCKSTGSPAAARQAGCKFDLFVNGWVPSPCFDAEKHDYFVNLRDYYFWVDSEKQQRVHQEKLLEGNLEFPELFVSFEEHFEHCRYLLNATKRYAHNPRFGVLDVHRDEEHMNHCIDFLKESRDPYTVELEVRAYFGYRKCYLPRWDKA
ncbi:hypothetical protein MY4824_004885 [Beauveria thailandica]